MRPIPSRRAGLALMAMLMVITMISVFMLVAARLMNEAFRTTRQAQAAQAHAVRLEGMLDLLHSDVWQAGQIEVRDGAELKLGNGPGDVTWTIQADGSVMRQHAGEASRTFAGAGKGLRFEVGRGGVVLRLNESSGGHSDERVLMSQHLLAGGGQ